MKIHVLTTGGTIDKVYFDAKSEFEVGPRVQVNLGTEQRGESRYRRMTSGERAQEDRGAGPRYRHRFGSVVREVAVGVARRIRQGHP